MTVDLFGVIWPSLQLKQGEIKNIDWEKRIKVKGYFNKDIGEKGNYFKMSNVSYSDFIAVWQLLITFYHIPSSHGGW